MTNEITFLNSWKILAKVKERDFFSTEYTTTSKDPKTWEEMVQRLNDLPGDEPTTWQPILKLNKNDSQNNKWTVEIEVTSIAKCKHIGNWKDYFNISKKQ